MSGIYKFQREDAYRFADIVSIPTRVRGDELIFQRCPYCGQTSKDKEKFAINLIDGTFNCFREKCKAKGNMLTLAKDFPEFELNKDVSAYYNINGFNNKFRRFKKTAKREVTDKAVEYLKSRGISEDICRKYEVTTKTDDDSVLCFPFKDTSDVLTFIKYRNINPKREGAKEWCEKDCKPILFGMNHCDMAIDTLIITEGQIDSLSVSEVGIPNAVSVPIGCNGFSWVPHCWNFMRKFKRIVIFGDYEREHMTLLEEIQRRFKRIKSTTVYHVRYEDYKDCKDANEILQKYGAEQIRKCVANAEAEPLRSFKQVSEIEDVNESEIQKIPTGIEALDKLLRGGLPTGGFSIVTGKTNEGKSILCSQIIASALEHNYRCLVYSGEMMNSQVKNWLLRQLAGANHIKAMETAWYGKNYTVEKEAIAKISAWLKDKLWIYTDSEETDDDTEKLLSEIEDAINRYGIKVILIDNLMTAMLMNDEAGKDVYEKQTSFVNKLKRLCMEYQIHIVLVAHRGKANRDDANLDIMGSSNIGNLANVILSYETPTGEGADPKTRLLKLTKNRLFGDKDLNGIHMQYDEVTRRVFNNSCEKIPHQKWLNDGEIEWQKVAGDEEIPY